MPLFLGKTKVVVERCEFRKPIFTVANPRRRCAKWLRTSVKVCPESATRPLRVAFPAKSPDQNHNHLLLFKL